MKLAFILLISIVGPFPLIMEKIPKPFCYHVLSAIFVIVSIVAGYQIIKGNWKLKDIGITKDYINRRSLLWYGSALVLSIIVFFSLYRTEQVNDITIKTIVLSFLVSAAQVVLYQGYLMKVGHEIFREKLWPVNVLMNVILYTYMHAFYSLSNLEYVLIVAAGIMFATLYRYFPNIFLVIILHFITNLQAIYLGMFQS